MYVPPVLKELGMAEVESNPKNNRIHALPRDEFFAVCPAGRYPLGL